MLLWNVPSRQIPIWLSSLRRSRTARKLYSKLSVAFVISFAIERNKETITALFLSLRASWTVSLLSSKCFKNLILLLMLMMTSKNWLTMKRNLKNSWLHGQLLFLSLSPTFSATNSLSTEKCPVTSNCLKSKLKSSSPSLSKLSLRIARRRAPIMAHSLPLLISLATKVARVTLHFSTAHSALLWAIQLPA